jgi:hypothetical protein
MANGNGRSPTPDSGDLTEWLVEAGRRAWYTGGPEKGKGNTERPAERPMARSGAVRRMVLLTLFAVSFLQYYYLTVAVEIASLPALVVFLPT